MAALDWDIFCRVIDNHGDVGVCWRVAAQLGARGHRVRLFIDDASALEWMAPHGAQGVQVLPWADSVGAMPATVAIEAFGCELEPAYQSALADRAARSAASAWINLEYLSAERFVLRNHGLASPIFQGPAQGLTKYFFYPGFTDATGGLPREDDLLARRQRFDRNAWHAAHATGWTPHERVISLFCYEPDALGDLLSQLAEAAQAPTRMLVTAGRATAAVQSVLQRLSQPRNGFGALALHYLPYLSQTAFDEMLWACDLDFVRGEDSLVRALWSGRPFVWQIYPQHDDAHHAKLEAFLAWMSAGPSLSDFMRRWNGLGSGPLPAIDLAVWSRDAEATNERARALPDLCSRLEAFAKKLLQAVPVGR